MNSNRHNPLLLALPLARELPLALIEKSAAVADKVGYAVLAFCPAVSAQASTDGSGTPSSGAEVLRLAQAHAETAAAMLRDRGVAAEALTEHCQSSLDASLASARETRAAVLMTTTERYDDWAHSLTRSGHLERPDNPALWLHNEDGPTEGIVLGAVALEDSAVKAGGGDDDVARQSSRIAAGLGTDAHLLHVTSAEPSLRQTVAAALAASGGKPDPAGDPHAERDTIARVHALARRWQIPAERVHVHRGDFADEIAELSASMPVALIVLGSHPRAWLKRLLVPSTPRVLSSRVRSDLLILRHDRQ